MHIYEVDFQSHFANYIDKGRILVSANSNEEACLLTTHLLDLPGSSTQCFAIKIKSNAFILERSQIPKPKAELKRDSSSRVGLVAAIKKQDEYKLMQRAKSLVKYDVHLVATVRSRDEQSAMRRIGRIILDRAENRPTLDGHISGMVFDVNPVFGQREIA